MQLKSRELEQKHGGSKREYLFFFLQLSTFLWVSLTLTPSSPTAASSGKPGDLQKHIAMIRNKSAKVKETAQEEQSEFKQALLRANRRATMLVRFILSPPSLPSSLSLSPKPRRAGGGGKEGGRHDRVAAAL